MNLRALTHSTIATFAFITFMTVYSELSKPFKDFLAAVAGHHWVTKGIFAILFFIAISFLLSKIEGDRDVKNEALWVVAATVTFGLAIFLFFVLHFLGE